MTVFPPSIPGLKAPETLKSSVSHLALKSMEMQKLTMDVSNQVSAILWNNNPIPEVANDNKPPVAMAA